MKTLNVHQVAFVDATEQYVGLFGGVGNGKTYIASCACISLATKYPNNLILIGRQTYPELRDSTREVFLSALSELYPPTAYQFNKSETSVTFWNKSQVIFRHLDEWRNLLSMNLGAFYIDQAEEVEEDAFLTLQSRLRRQNTPVLKGLVTGNPRGYNWVYFKFGMDKAGGSSNWRNGDNYRMITAPTLANAANLPANYIEQLRESYSPEWYARYVMGSWDAFEGQIFDLTKITGYDTLPPIKMVLTACDPAISKKTTACNTAFCTVGIGVDGHIYDLETIASKWGFQETLEEAAKILKRQKSSYLGVENVAYQKALLEACQREFPDITVVDLKADKDKFRRAKSVSHIVNRGLFHTNNRDLMNELSAFVPDAEGKEKKDRVDAMVHVLHMAQQFGEFTAVKEPTVCDWETPSQAFFRQSRAYEKKLYQHSQSNFDEFNPSDNSIEDPDYY